MVFIIYLFIYNTVHSSKLYKYDSYGKKQVSNTDQSKYSRECHSCHIFTYTTHDKPNNRLLLYTSHIKAVTFEYKIIKSVYKIKSLRLIWFHRSIILKLVVIAAAFI